MRCCVWFLFFSLLFFSFLVFFKYRKTAFGLNLREAESGMVVALAGNYRETSTAMELCLLLHGLTNPPYLNGQSLCDTREDCLSCHVSELDVEGQWG